MAALITRILLTALLFAVFCALAMGAACVHRWRDGHIATKAEIVEDIREDLS